MRLLAALAALAVFVGIPAIFTFAYNNNINLQETKPHISPPSLNETEEGIDNCFFWTSDDEIEELSESPPDNQSN